MAADSPNRWNLLRMLSRCAFCQAQAANNVTGTTPIPANATVTPTSILEGIHAGNFSAQITDGRSRTSESPDFNADLAINVLRVGTGRRSEAMARRATRAPKNLRDTRRF
ncbi:MAG: hypothetical protein ABSE16_20795 [Verrucomicrobiota bacterium]|jgi:predicted RNA-binding Zn ribbon-like protein